MATIHEFTPEKLKFMVINQYQIQTINPNLKHIVISISSTYKSFPVYPKNDSRVDILRLYFNDIDSEMTPYQLFVKSQAFEILQFVFKYIDDIEMVIIQCEAGISRSAAIAVALTEICWGDRAHGTIVFRKRYSLYNRFIYKMVRDVFHEMKHKFIISDEVFDG